MCFKLLINRILLLSSFFALLLSGPPLRAEEQLIELKLDNSVTATATYKQGDTDKPVVLLLHGFLITREHATLKNLNLAISEAGYSTLAPTLSLDIDRRKRSLACEAIHTHTMEKDSDEINRWITWLKQQGHKKIIFLGHSFGSLNMLVYLKQSADMIHYAIATSLVNFEHAINDQNVDDQMIRARQALKTGEKTALQHYKISYCKNYLSTAESFISYAHWNKKNILKLLNEIDTPLQIVIGSSDQRMEQNWPQTLKKLGKEVSIIQGANHFFSNEYEFDLHDRILDILSNI